MGRPVPSLTLEKLEKEFRLEEDGKYPIHVDGDLVGWAYRFGREYGIEYGDLALAAQEGVDLSRDLDIGPALVTVHSHDGSQVLDVFETESKPVPFCTRLPFFLPGDAPFRVDKRDVAYRDFLIGGGPTLDEVPVGDLDRFYRWGPSPDPEDTDATGSGRVHAHRSPVEMSILVRDIVLGEQPTHEQAADLDRWIVEQCARGYWATLWMKPRTLEDKPTYTGADVVRIDEFEVYDAHAMRDYIVPGDDFEGPPGLVLGNGYRVMLGGFWAGFGRRLPEGVDWDGSGLAAGSSLHMTVDSLVFGAVFFRSQVAAEGALSHFQAASSFLWAGEKWPSRGHGWQLDCGAKLAPVLRYQKPHVTHSVIRSIEKSLNVLAAQNKGGMPAPDNGQTIEGGHLTYDEVKVAFEDVIRAVHPEWSDKQVHDAIVLGAESDAAFYVGILITGLDHLLSLWDAYGVWQKHPDGAPAGADMRRLAMEQHKYATNFLVNICAKPKLDVHQGITAGKRVPSGGIWSDAGTAFGLGEGGDDGNTIKGTNIRFVVGALALSATRHGMPEILEIGRTTLGICNQAKWWNGKDKTAAMLECLWPVAAHYGWNGTFNVKSPSIVDQGKAASTEVAIV